MIDQLIIRKAKDSDLDSIWEIFQDVVKTGDTYVFRPDISKAEALEYWIYTSKYQYVAEFNNEIVGSFIMRDNRPDLGSHIANASYIVSKNARGKSVGRKMGEYSIEEARRLGYKAMQFNMVISTNEPAVKLWQSLGFTIIGTVEEAYKNLALGKFVDAYIMYRKL